jgi:hypothetical protein
MLNQSRDPTQLWGSAHLCKLDSREQWRALTTEKKIEKIKEN